MKRFLFFITLLLSAANSVFAVEVEINGLWYEIESQTKEAKVIEYKNDVKYSGDIIIPESIAFEGTTYSVTSIGNSAFMDCTNLTSISIPESVTSFEKGVFYGCIGLTSITIPSGMNTIGPSSFMGCTGLTSITIPKSVKEIGVESFSGCISLQSMIVEDGNTVYDSRQNCNAIIETSSNTLNFGCKQSVIPNSVTSIGSHAFNGCTNLSSINIPEGVICVGHSAFAFCSSLTSIIIPESVSTIEDEAFINCTNLTSINIPKDVTSIRTRVFAGCSSLTSITIPESVSIIEQGSFAQCGLISVTIPKGIVKIGWEAFENNIHLQEFVCLAPNVPITDEDAFSLTPINNIVLKVPAKSVGKYKVAKPWTSFKEIVGIETNDYTLTYMVDGEVYKEYTVEAGEQITPEAEPTKEGYTFSGWSDIPETMPANDVTVTGTFSINKYTLTYMVDGEVYKTYEVEPGATITPEAEPTKDGYTFSGWSDIPQTMPANDVTVTGSFELTSGTFTLTYVVDGETYKSVSYDYGVTIEPEAEPTKEGYTFSGWSEIPQTMPARDVTVSGYFSVNTYTLTYMVDDEVYKTYEVEYGSTITPEEEPTKDDYIFSGWSDIPETMPAEDVTVTGYFMMKTYVLTYVVDDETYKTVTYEYGEAITPEVEPTKEGYTFSGWSEIPETMPANDLTVTGSFTVNKYKLVYQVDGDVYKTYEVEYGVAITAENEPTKEGYTFSGWSEIPEKMPAEDVTVTGTFTINKYKLTYMVDGEEYKSFEIEYGTAITPEDELTKEGYTFSGWSEIPSTMPADDVAVTGTFTVNKYKLIYMVDGKEYKAYEVEYGSSITPETDPTKEGYIFSGWDNVPETMPANDVTVSGTFTIGTYTLTYLVDGEEYKTISYEYGATITAEDEPTKEGYTFSGWSDIPSTMPGNNITVTGTFTVNKYKLTYTVDGEEYKSFEVDYGSSITPEEEPSKDGYIFSGWSKIPLTMPAHDVEITGKFTPLINVVDDVTYEITGGGTVTVKGGDEKGEVIIEATVEINGQTYFVTAIASNAFKDNKDITSLTIADGITVIGDNAFEGCTGISVINIGKAVLIIGNKAFANVGTSSSDVRRRSEGGSLVVNCYAESVPFTASDAFENSPIAAGKLFVNDNLVEDFKATAPWSNFGMIYGFNDPSAINAFTIDTENAHIYDIHGNRLDNVRKGVNIIRTRDGKTKKVMMK